MIERLWAVSLFSLACSSSAEAASAEVSSPPFTVATWNVHNLLMSEPDYASRLPRVAERIARFNADAVLLQEVGGEPVTRALLAEPALAGLGYQARNAIGNDARGIELVLLSRLPPVFEAQHREERFDAQGVLCEPREPGCDYAFARDVLEVELALGTSAVVLLGVHFKSKFHDDPGRRLAEARRTRALAEEWFDADANVALAVLGDFNATPGEPARQALEGSEPPLVGAASELPLAEAWSARSPSGEPLLHDDVLVSPALAGRLDASRVRVLHEESVPEQLRGLSDHAPVLVSFREGE
jgi:endonuclease/exonuclease/phosphatase family metal-dependent hydrolase